MCSRYYVEMSPELRPYVEQAASSPLKEKMVMALGKPFKAEGEIRPADMAAVIAPNHDGERTAYPMIWGYQVPGINHPLFNARVETAGEKKTFSDDWKRHRCIVPASWYFEWEHMSRPDGSRKTGDKYSIQPRGAEVTWLAGLYRIQKWRDLSYPVFTILTREPSEALRKIHDRMPLILPSSSINDWIRPDADPQEIVRAALTDMVFEKAD